MKNVGQGASGKKEKEKQKAQNKQAKERKKEERKSHSSKGKSLEEMFAYVDEDGNLSDVPPDPSKKKEISLDDIQLGAARQVEANPADAFRTGTVTFFNDAKGYGFINDEKNRASVFVHINQISEPIKERDKVTFEVEMGPKGMNAVRVKKVK